MANHSELAASVRHCPQRNGDTCGEAGAYHTRVREYYVYIMTSLSRQLYVGVTSDLRRRVWQHKHGALPGFTRKYRITDLVYLEQTTDIHAAIARAKQLKRWPRWRKDRLIAAHNAGWLNVSVGWFRDAEGGSSDVGSRSPDHSHAGGR